MAAEDEEDGLKGIFGRVVVGTLTAQVQDHWAVVLLTRAAKADSDTEESRRSTKMPRELAIGQTRGGAEMVEGGEVARCLRGESASHPYSLWGNVAIVTEVVPSETGVCFENLGGRCCFQIWISRADAS